MYGQGVLYECNTVRTTTLSGGGTQLVALALIPSGETSTVKIRSNDDKNFTDIGAKFNAKGFALRIK